MRVVYANHHNRIPAKADADYRRVSVALCVPSANMPLVVLGASLNLGGSSLLAWIAENLSINFDAMERQTRDQSHYGVNLALRCPGGGQT
jgi:hypothetical protein